MKAGIYSRYQRQTAMMVATLVAESSPATLPDRLKLIGKMAASRKRSLQSVQECKRRAALSFTMDEMSYYMAEEKRLQEQVNEVERALRMLSQYAVDHKISSAARAQLF